MAVELSFGLSLYLQPLLVCGGTEGSGEAVQMSTEPFACCS